MPVDVLGEKLDALFVQGQSMTEEADVIVGRGQWKSLVANNSHRRYGVPMSKLKGLCRTTFCDEALTIHQQNECSRRFCRRFV